MNLEQATQSIENLSRPGDVFRSMVESAVQLFGSEGVPEDFIDELCNYEGLARVSIHPTCILSITPKSLYLLHKAS